MGPQTRIPLQRKERRLWTSVVSAVNCNTLVVAAEEIDSLQVFIARITINPMKVCEIAVLENARNPAIAANSNGNCVVVWEDISDSSEIAVKLASLISDHSKLDEPFKVVNTGKVNIADNIADVDINNNGDIAVVYTDTARVDRVFSKRYCFSEGSISPGDRLMISRDTEDRPQAHHRSPSVAMRANNSYVVAWESVLRDEENLLHTRVIKLSEAKQPCQGAEP